MKTVLNQVGFKKEPLTYRHNDLPHHKDLHAKELKSALTSLFDEYTTDTATKKLVPFANSQKMKHSIVL